MSAPGWRDHENRLVRPPEPPPEGSYYGPIGDFQGAGYERNAFTYGTAQEAAAIWKLLEISPGQVVVDVGCGTGRHLRALQGDVTAVGLDLSAGLLAAAQAAAPALGWVRADARRLPLGEATADVVLCLCQGGFGITPGGDRQVLAELARVLRPGGRLALTAFSLVFAARHLAPGDAIDLRRGLHHARAEVRGGDDARRTFDLWTSCYSPAHLEDLVRATGLHLDVLTGAEPGRYGTNPPGLDDPELLLVATKP